MTETLPPGPRMPAILQTIGNWSRPTAFLDARAAPLRQRLHRPPARRAAVRDDLRPRADQGDLPGAARRPAPRRGRAHPRTGRRPQLGDPARRGARTSSSASCCCPRSTASACSASSGLMEELTERELDSWPRGEPIALHPRLQRLTLEIILRAVFGLERGARLDSLRELLTRAARLRRQPALAAAAAARRGGRSFAALRGRREGRCARVDERDLRADRRAPRARATHEDAEDVLAMLLAARHEDGSPMSPQELRDELITALVAGHETTASQLAWAFARLAREPAALGAPARRDRRRRERRVPDRDDQRGHAPAPGAAERRAAARQAAGRDRRRALPAGRRR